MSDVINAISEMIDDHWVKFVTAGAFTLAGWLLAHRRAKKQWERREFFNRINTSLNMLHGGFLRIRTLAEKECAQVFLNSAAVDNLIRAAQQTTVENPIIPLRKDDYWYYLNSVLNELSEQFADGLLRQDMEQPGTEHAYVICLTNECDGEVRTRKIRAMVIRKDRLKNLSAEMPKLESPHHAIRFKTLQVMQTALQEEPWKLLEVNLIV